MMKDRNKPQGQPRATFQNVRIIYLYPFLFSPIDFSNQLRNALGNKEVKNGMCFGEETVKHLKPSIFFYGPRFVKHIDEEWPIKNNEIRVGPFPGDFDQDISLEKQLWVSIPVKSLKLRGRLVVFYTGVGLADLQVDFEPLGNHNFDTTQVIALSSWGEHFPASVYIKDYLEDGESNAICLKVSDSEEKYLLKIFEDKVEEFRKELEDQKSKFGNTVRFIDFRQAGFQEQDKITRLDSIPEKWQEDFNDFMPIVWRDGIPKKAGTNYEAKERFGWQIPYPFIILKTGEEVSSFTDRYSVDIASILFKSLTPSKADMGFFMSHHEALDEKLINRVANKKIFVTYSLKSTVMLCASFEDNPSRYTIPSLRDTLDFITIEYYPLSILHRLLDHEIWRMLTNIEVLSAEHLKWRKRLVRLKLYALSLVQELVPLRTGTASFKELYAVASEKLRLEQLRSSVEFKVNQLDSLLSLILETSSLESASRIESRIKSLADGDYALTMLMSYARALESNERIKLIKKVEKLLTIYKITEQVLKALKGRVPNVILKELEKIKDEEFLGEEELSRVLKKTIGEKSTVEYRQLILEHAGLSYFLRPEKES
jgi:hypothetical protein